ncbi:MAG TPA: hypothetical protein VE999_01815 [Gemmataceae bacterium]|nr:hypothetical protein [Gemmataceae bacterium]
MTTNPFEILRLDPSATEEEIVRQAGRLRQRATDEETRNAIRQAVQALTARAEDRELLALLTHPRPRHHWPALERFTAAFRRAPAAPGPAQACPPLDMEELTDIFRGLIAEELELPPLPFEPIASGETPREIERQSAEALWQSLLFDPGA